MASLQINSQNSRKYSVIALLVVTLLAGIAAVVIGTQLDRNLAGTDSDAALLPCEDFTRCTSTSSRCEGNTAIVCENRTCLSSQTGGQVTISVESRRTCGAGQRCDVLTENSGAQCVNAPPQGGFGQACSTSQPCQSAFACTADQINGGNRCWGRNLANGSGCINNSSCDSNRCVSGTCQAASTGGGGQPTDPTPNPNPNPGPGPTNPPAPSSTSTSTTNTCGGTDRINGCQCVRDNQCISGFCNSAGQCARPDSCLGSNRPNGCQCGNNGQCSTGNCQLGNDGVNRCRPTGGCGNNPDGRINGCYCVNNGQCASNLCNTNINTCVSAPGSVGGGGGGGLPSTGLFDEEERPLLIGLILIGLGFFLKYAANSSKIRPQINANSIENLYNDIDKDIARIINSQAKRKK